VNLRSPRRRQIIPRSITTIPFHPRSIVPHFPTASIKINHKMTRQLTACTVLALCSCASAWTPSATSLQSRVSIHAPTASALHSTPDASDPCWQDNYDSDDDCLSTVYSAAFVAEEWIQSMPCGKDADCLPEQLSHPGTMGDAVSEKATQIM